MINEEFPFVDKACHLTASVSRLQKLADIPKNNSSSYCTSSGSKCKQHNGLPFQQETIAQRINVRVSWQLQLSVLPFIRRTCHLVTDQLQDILCSLVLL